MKLQREYFIKILITLVYLSPFIVAYFKNEKISFSNIYYIGIALSFLSLVKLKDEIANNWIFSLTLILFTVNLIFVGMYYFF